MVLIYLSTDHLVVLYMQIDKGHIVLYIMIGP